MAGCSIDDRFKHLKEIGRWLIAEVSHVWQMEYRELCDELHAKDLELDDAAEDIRLLVGDVRRSNYDQSALEWLLAESDWKAWQNARRAEHYASALSADNRLGRWLIAEQKWLTDRACEIADMWWHGHEALDDEWRIKYDTQNDLARWLLAEMLYKLQKQIGVNYDLAAAQDLARWLIAEQGWNAGQEFLRGLAAPSPVIGGQQCISYRRTAIDRDIALWLLAEKEHYIQENEWHW